MLELCLCAIIFVAVFRKILLSEDIPARSFSFKRGLEQKTVFTFKPYFRFGKREAAYAALNILFIIVFTGSADWYREARFEAIIESGAKNLDLSPYDQVFIIGLVIRILEFIAMSACIFLWPYIALTDKIRWSEIKQKLAGTRDNIGRIMLVILIMYLPYEAAYKTLFNLWLSINENVEEGLSLYIKIAVDAVRIIIYYICTLCEVAFISNLWKSLINNEVKEQK
ncbi:MAG: hypothetical protein KDI13_00560 [Alphaproteobacteria bacterium]|nr:hypothetical protein [Alphaproteobacteria bacterium]